MRTEKAVRRSVAWLALASGVFLSVAGTAHADSAFDEAMEHYEQAHWAEAFERFAKLADAGQAEAARIAVLMRRHGPSLYANAFGASQTRVDGWVRVASGAPVAPIQSAAASERR